MSEETHVLTKQETLLGKDARVESRRTQEDCSAMWFMVHSLGVRGDGISFWVVLSQSF